MHAQPPCVVLQLPVTHHTSCHEPAVSICCDHTAILDLLTRSIHVHCGLGATWRIQLIDLCCGGDAYRCHRYCGQWPLVILIYSGTMCYTGARIPPFPGGRGNFGLFGGIFRPIVGYMQYIKYPACGAIFSTLIGRLQQQLVTDADSF